MEGLQAVHDGVHSPGGADLTSAPLQPSSCGNAGRAGDGYSTAPLATCAHTCRRPRLPCGQEAASSSTSPLITFSNFSKNIFDSFFAVLVIRRPPSCASLPPVSAFAV